MTSGRKQIDVRRIIPMASWCILIVGLMGGLTACAEFAEDPVESEVGVPSTRSTSLDMRLPAPSMDQSLASGDMGFTQSDAAVTCDRPGRVGLCMFCDTNGNLFQPETDSNCPELSCLSLVGFERVETSFASACVNIQPPSPARACGGVGRCATEIEFCEQGQSEPYYQVFRDGCETLVSCDDADTASAMNKPSGAACAVTSGPRFARIRLRVIETEQPIRFEHVKLGTVTAEGQRSFPQYVITSVEAAGEDGRTLLGGGADISLSAGDRIEVEFGMSVTLSLVQIILNTNGEARLDVEGGLQDAAWMPWETKDIQAATTEVHFMPRGTCDGRGQCIAADRFDCSQVLATVGGGPLCSSSEELGNSYCEFFVPNIGRSRSCAEVCAQANLQCITAKSDTDNDCRVSGNENCDHQMNDFVCRCAP